MSTNQTPGAINGSGHTTDSKRRVVRNPDRPTFKDATTLVTFIIGKAPNQHEYKVHKENACTRCPVFERAFSTKGLPEGDTLVYRLDDFDSQGAFRFMVQYLYTENIEPVQLSKGFVDKGGEWPDVGSEDEDLIQLWVLAEKYLMPKLQNLVIDTISMIQEKCELFSVGSWGVIYEETPAESPLRRLAVYQAAGFQGDSLSECLMYMSPEMKDDLILFQAEHTGRRGLTYHSLYVPVPEDDK